jgi:hypothetical protein
MNMKTINLSKVNGKKAIGSDDLVYCNTKYHAPYLAIISSIGEMNWQEKLYIGYGKYREAYYNVENLKPGDYIQASGGSGGNKYPFKGKVAELTETTLVVEEIPDAEFSNIIAERKKSVNTEFSALEKIIPELREKINKNEITSAEFAFISIYNFGKSVSAYQHELGRQILTQLEDRIDDIKTPSSRIVFEKGN